jgi:hypothetical protein
MLAGGGLFEFQEHSDFNDAAFHLAHQRTYGRIEPGGHRDREPGREPERYVVAGKFQRFRNAAA